MAKKSVIDYRVNYQPGSGVLSVEVTCCHQRIGEMRFADQQSLTCPHCQARHVLSIEHNHFHLSQHKKDA